MAVAVLIYAGCLPQMVAWVRVEVEPASLGEAFEAADKS